MFSGGTVHMVCRNRERAEEAREFIINESGNTVGLPLCWENIGKLAQIFNMHGSYRRFTSTLWTWQRHVRSGSLLKVSSSITHRWTCWLVVFSIDLLTDLWFTLDDMNFSVWFKINNAGCMVHERELNAERLEKNFATNTMGETSIGSMACLPSNLVTEEAKHVLPFFLRHVHPHPGSHSTPAEQPQPPCGMRKETHTNPHKQQHSPVPCGRHNATSVHKWGGCCLITLSLSSLRLLDHCVLRRHARPEAQNRRSAVAEGTLWWPHGLRPEQGGEPISVVSQLFVWH